MVDQSHFGSTPTAFEPHPLRRTVLDEVHARPFLKVVPPRRFIHYAFSTDAAAIAKDRLALDHWCELTSAARPEPHARYHAADFPSARLRWECHTEFTTYTWDCAGGEGGLFHWPLLEAPPVPSAIPTPGPLVVAADVMVIDRPLSSAALEDLFDAASLCVADVMDGAARVVTDFRQDSRGFTRILIADQGLTPVMLGALVQRLLEVETYRSFAMLGLPEAMRVSPALRRGEEMLVNISQAMRESRGLEGNSALLEALVAQTAELEAEAAASAYRFGATKAYADIVRSRLATLAEKPVDGYSTPQAVLQRRMAPALRTCQSISDRQADLSRKLARAANLLRTRVDVEMQSQNRVQLESMNQRARLQLRLQQTVEGLSVAAVSYYVLGLFGYVFKGAHEAGLLRLEPALATALALPVVVVGMWLIVRRIRKSHSS